MTSLRDTMTKPWADKPFELLNIPGQPGAKSCDNPDVMFVSIEMANAHNALLRGLNSVYLQAPHVIKPEDIADFLLYAQAWASTVHHHHTVEEQIFFPAVDKLVQEAGIADSSMNPNVDQHQLFEPEIEKFLKWVEEVRDGEKEYDSKTLLSLIDDFAPILTQHLHDEIDTLLKLEKCDGEKLKKCMKDTADESLKTADPVCFTFYIVPKQRLS